MEKKPTALLGKRSVTHAVEEVIKVAILHGYVPPDASKDEQDVLVQVEAVAQTLTVLGYEPIAVPLTLDLAATAAVLQQLRPSLVFNLVETVNGEGQYIHLGPTLLDGLHLPYTGAPTTVMFATSNKLLAKTILAAAGLPTPPWFALQGGPWHPPSFSGPYLVKSVWEHGSIGLDDASVVADATLLEPLLARRGPDRGAPWFVERYIAGREFNVSLLAGAEGPEVLPLAEIVFAEYPADKVRIVGYPAKWEEDSFEYQHTYRRFDFPPQDAPVLRRMAALAKTCWHTFGLRGYARVDLRLDETGQPWILEVNANPCLASDGGFVAAARQAGWSLAELIQCIIADCPAAALASFPCRCT
jgi:D-alanine-D-alanine ligase